MQYLLQKMLSQSQAFFKSAKHKKTGLVYSHDPSLLNGHSIVPLDS